MAGAPPSERGPGTLGGADASPPLVTQLTLTSRLRGSRGVVVFLLAVVTAPIITLLLIRNVTTTLQGPNYGITAWGSPHVFWSDDRWPDLQRYDRIVAVGSTPIHSARAFREAKQRAHGTLTVTFERDGRRWTETAKPSGWSLSYEAGAWSRVASAILLLLVAIAAYLLRPGTSVSILFLVMCYTLACAIAMTWLFPESWIGSLLLDATLPTTAAATLHIFCKFPEPSPTATRHPHFWLLIYGPPAVLVAIKTIFDYGRPFNPVWMFASTALWLWVAVALIAGLAMLIAGYRRASRQQALVTKARYKLLIIAAAVGMGIPLVANIAIAVFAAWFQHQVVFEIATGAIVIFPAAQTYVLVRQNAFEVDRFTANVLGYAATIGTLVLAYGAMLGIAWWIASAAGFGHSPVALVAFVGAGAATLLPASRRLKRRADAFFSREQASADAIVEATQELRRRVHGHGNSGEALDAAFAALDLLRGARTELWLRDDAQARFVRDRASIPPDAGRPSTIAIDSALGRLLANGQLAGVPSLAPRALPTQAAVELFALDLAMAATFSHAGEVRGFLAVGRRLSGTSYSMNELGMLATVATEVGVALGANDENRVLGRYRLERRLGVGGMAEVYLARQVGPGGFERRVAIKRPLPAVSEDPSSIARFLDEARIAARLHHDNIVQIYEVGVEDGKYFIVMEYVAGHTLRQLIAQARANRLFPPIPVAVGIMEQALDALHHVHTRTEENGSPSELIHRDVTPSNILISANGNAKLVDFGIARAADRLAQTQTGGVRGTMAYMSPEQANARDLDPRTDIYSAGCVAYELISLERISTKKTRPRPLQSLVPNLPEGVARAITRAVAFDRDERFFTARGFGDALRDGLDQPVASNREIAAWVDEVIQTSAEAPPPPERTPATPGPTATAPSGTLETRTLTRR